MSQPSAEIRISRETCLRWAWGLLVGGLAIAVAREGLPHVSADNLYGYCFLRDILSRGTPIAWSLPHSPYFFPDLLLVLPGVLLGAGVAVTYHIAFALHLAMLWGSIRWLCRTASPSVPVVRHGDAATRALGLYLASVLLYRHFDAAPVYFPTMHANGLPAGVLLVSLSVSILFADRCKIPALLFLLIGTLVFLSDEIVLAQFGVPVAVFAVIGACALRVPWRRAALLVGLLIAGAMLARMLYAMLATWPELLLKRPYVGFSFRGVGLLARALARQSPELLRDGAVGFLAAGAWIGGLAVWAARGRDGRCTAPGARAAWCHGALLAVIPCTLVATLGGLLVTQHERVPQRYLLPVFFIPFVGWAVLEASGCVSRRLCRFVQFGIPVVAVVGLLSTAHKPGSLSTPYPPWVQAVDRVAQRHGLRRGFASYDRAKPLTALSRAGLRVAALRGEMPYVWIDNSYGFLDCEGMAPRLVPYDFILPEGLRENRLRQVYGRPAERARTAAGLDVWIYDPAQGRPMNMHHFVGSLQAASRGFGYALEFTIPPAVLRLEGEDLTAPASDLGDETKWSGDGAGRLDPGKAMVTPWQRVVGGTQVATARVAWLAPSKVTFGLGPSAEKLLQRTEAEGNEDSSATNLCVRLDTEGLSDLRLVVRNDGPGAVVVDYVELRGELSAVNETVAPDHALP